MSYARFDELGRPWRTELCEDGTNGCGTSVKTDTTFDILGRKETVSNPHRSTSDPTYGITTFAYDALGRVTMVIPPDGTSSSNHVLTDYFGNTTTVTDQQGKQRRSLTDALGRLIQVDEPTEGTTGGSGEQSATPGTGSATVSGTVQTTQVETAPTTAGTGWASVSGSVQSKQVESQPATPGTGWATVSGSVQSKQVQTAAATAGTGSVTVSGSEQSTQVETQAATAGTGSVTINGSEQSTQVETQAATAGTGSVTISGAVQSTVINLCDWPEKCFTTIYDSGTVSITVNGLTKSVTYGQGSTANTIASALRSAINGDSGYPVTAAGTGGTVTLTAKQNGTATNYSLSAGSFYNTTYFSQPSFTATRSGSTLTGGQDAQYTTVYDSGTVWVKVNTFTATASYGQGSTASGIASSLRSILNGGSSPVTAGGTGTTITLTSKTTGASTNYSLTVGRTYDTSNFSSPSFTASRSGSTLTGGADAQFTTVYDSGTVWAKVGSFTATASFSQGSTTSSIATSLRSILNGGSSPVTAGGTGTTITLTSKTTGASTNYSLTVGRTYDTSNFSSPSFTASRSGTTLTGGADAQFTTVYDSGTVKVTVNDFTATANFGQGSTTSTIATSLRNTLNGASSPVTASGTGGTVNLASKTTGASTNYSLSVSWTYNTSEFSSASFTATKSGDYLTGGADSGVQTIYDSGNVTVTVDGFQASAPYSQGSTFDNVAASLRTTFNTDPASPVTASGTGGTVNLTSKATGASTNYTLVVASNYDTNNFTSPSFPVTRSGDTLTGGADAQVQTVYDTGTVTITVGGYLAVASYGQGSTVSSIASSLRSTFNTDPASPASAAGTGGTVGLTSKATGTASNYSLSAGSTYDTGNFGSASFLTSTSGSTFIGGQDYQPPVPPDWSLATVVSTLYTYDVFDNLTFVNQGNRDRSFVYNSFLQLTSAANPESGTTTYTYDNDGNLKTKKDARNITITYTYDGLHRLKTKSYSNGDPSVSYFYDQTSYNGLTIAKGKGRRTGMSDAAGAEAWSYDQMGQVIASRRITNGVTKSFAYGYFEDGTPEFVTYPSGRTVGYAYDAVGRALSAQDTLNGINYATQAAYAPHSALSSLKLGVSGSFAGITRTWSYNPRLQPSLISAASPTQTVLSLSYDFDLGVANNGNLAKIVNYLDGERTQAFSYDGLNRVEAAGAGNDWALSYAYDRYGNLLQKSVTRGAAPMLSVTVNSQNRITNAGFSYDAAGNLTGDGSFSYAYDAESRMTTTAGVSYTYDGDGQRVKKSNGTLYWYGIAGEVLVESQLNGTLKDEYVFFNGQRVARRRASGAVNYFLADHLGSARVVTDATGSVVEDSDFYPFGGELVVVSSLDNHYKFTGKERDSESGLDYFQVRYYGSTLARFLSIDPGNTGAVAGDPQSWNAYAYTLNNPLFFVDPTGLASESAGQTQNTGPIKKCELDSAGKCKPPSPARNDHTARILCTGFSAEKCNQLTIFLFRSANLSVSGNKNVDRQIKQLVEDISKLKIKVEVEADEIGDIMGGEGLQPDAINIMAATGLERGYSPSAAGLYHASDRTSYVGVIINEFRDGRKPGAMTHETLHVLNRDINSENPGGRLREVRVRIQHLLIRLSLPSLARKLMDMAREE